jgi:transcription elongation factor SPT6
MFDSDEEEEEGEGDRGGGKVDLVSQVFGASDDEDEDDFDMDVIDKNKSSNSANKDHQKGKITFSDDDDFDGFIVGDDGRPIDQRKGGMFSEPALMEAQEIFGVDFNPADFGLASDDEDANDENVYRESDDEAAEEGTKSYQRKKSRKNRSIYDVYEPSELERSHFTDTDKTIRVVDVPERFQLRSVPIQNSEEGELDSEADWIYHQAFCSQPISRQPLCTFNQNGSLKPSSAVPKIKEALNFMRNYSFEVPFIATYRKEYIEPELNVTDLWKIFHWDLKWTQLQQRKNNLKKLFKDMQSWQFTKVREEPEKALTEDYHSIDDEDIGKSVYIITLNNFCCINQYHIL